MRTFLLSLITAIVLVLTGVGVSAQDATPGADAGSGSGELQTLAEAQVSDLPAPAFLGLVRFTFPAGSATPEGADPGLVVVSVESGSLTATIDGPAAVQDAEGMSATPANGQDLVLQVGDTVTVPAGTSSSFRNDGPDVATALAVMVFPEDPFGPFAAASLNGVDVELLVGGMVEQVPSPAVVLLSREQFAPGDSLPPAASTGPVLGFVEAGRLTYVVERGESRITPGVGTGTPTTDERSAEAATPGSESALDVGAGFVEEGGTVSGARNDGDAAAEVLIVLVWLPEALGPPSGQDEAATPVP
jgi:hypothetical protein